MSPRTDTHAIPSNAGALARRRWSRNVWTFIAFAPAGVVAIACFGLAGWHAWATPRPKWDDYLILGAGWLIAAAVMAILLRSIWALIAPERFLPRWAAVVLLWLVLIGALFFLLLYWMASAWGP